MIPLKSGNSSRIHNSKKAAMIHKIEKQNNNPQPTIYNQYRIPPVTTKPIHNPSLKFMAICTKKMTYNNLTIYLVSSSKKKKNLTIQ